MLGDQFRRMAGSFISAAGSVAREWGTLGTRRKRTRTTMEANSSLISVKESPDFPARVPSWFPQ